MRLLLLTVPLLAVTIFAPACASKSASTGPSVVSGKAALATFPRAPSRLVATDERGQVSEANLGADGQFALPLAKGHVYQLALATGDGSTVAVEFPRSSGKLGSSFALHTDGATIRLGSLHYLAGPPAGGFKLLSKKVTKTASEGGGGDCVDCVNDDESTVCDEGDGAEGAGSEGAPKAAEESLSSKSAHVGAPIVAPIATVADGNHELAIGDQNAPDDVAGCDSGGDDQQEGEH
ncbi:MAG: hypothetical protein NVS3B10_08640 [Polyangiales bacterium]